ncbi:MAG: 4Fe-4S dicluster domain-containing protein [Bacteroidales bacterium]|nr:4Fe-4S dicluster domain-containing protein [Bacteroidales bacterium]
MLRKTRICLAALCFVGITLLFVGIGRDWWGWLPKLQLLPATMRVIAGATLGNVAVLLGILLLTLLFGRIYCSVLCPLGVFQDLVLWVRRTLGRWIKPLRKRFKFNKERKAVRYVFFGILIVSIVAGIQLVVALLGPYSAYGRMVTSIAGKGTAPVIIAAAATFVVTAVCAWCWGRAYCNTVCPVGTLLGKISSRSVFGLTIDRDKCVKCGACARQCKASCIDDSTQSIDRSRCVGCFDCIDNCKVGAIRFGRPAKAQQEPDGASEGRRAFLNTSAVLIAGAAASGLARAQEMKVDGGLAPVEPKADLKREPLLVPPGAGSVKNFYDSCTACQLCVTACPNKVLRPSTDLEHLLQPRMGYENSFCRPECTACSEVCPAGAISPVDRDEKTLIRIGTAVVDPETCLAALGKEGCGNCERHCPTGAISMVTIEIPETQSVDSGGVGGNAPRPLGAQGDSSLSAVTGRRRRPVVAEEQCIGCGKCEYLCPVRPVSAITVKGLEEHLRK